MQFLYCRNTHQFQQECKTHEFKKGCQVTILPKWAYSQPNELIRPSNEIEEKLVNYSSKERKREKFIIGGISWNIM